VAEQTIGSTLTLPALPADGRCYVDRPCPVCAHGRRRVLLSQALGERMQLSLVECAACGMMYSAPRITARHRLELYRQWAADRAGQAHFDLAHQLGDADLYARAIRYLIPRLQGDRVLDFGCGGGLCLTLWRRSTRTVIAHGCSFDPGEVQETGRATGCSVHLLERLEQIPAQGYATITMFNVLEHVLDLSTVLALLRRHLADDGLLLVVAPNAWSLRQRVRLGATPHRDLALYEHVNHFTPASLRRCLGAAGFDVTTWLDDLARGVEPTGRTRSARQRVRDGLGRCANRWAGRPELFANIWAVAVKGGVGVNSGGPARGRAAPCAA
jgi:2-polyprenyl-3-methyl-5-hydroxy-6-metoxy-1,4-benzoquinol methylase